MPPRRIILADADEPSSRPKRTAAAEGLDTSLILSEPRAKRGRVDEFAASGRPTEKTEEVWEDPGEVLEKGRQLLSIVKNATEGEGESARFIATDFLKLPNRRQYPSYYEVIKHPVCLEDIETRIEESAYPNLDAVRADIEHCFWNAKKFNMTGSPIFQDAKHLHKLTKQTYATLTTPSAAPPIAPEPAPQPIASSSKPKRGLPVHLKSLAADPRAAKGLRVKKETAFEEEAKKAKKSSVWKTLKNRLDKVVGKKDKAGRMLAMEFMDLPSKALYPDYYKMIKHPRAFNTVFTKLKRNEYDQPDDFVEDVEYIFSNALKFNLDDSQIALDAVELRTYFHSLVDSVVGEMDEPSASSSLPKLVVKLKGDPEPAGGSPSLIKLKLNRKEDSASDVEMASGKEEDSPKPVPIAMPTTRSASSALASAPSPSSADTMARRARSKATSSPAPMSLPSAHSQSTPSAIPQRPPLPSSHSSSASIGKPGPSSTSKTGQPQRIQPAAPPKPILPVFSAFNLKCLPGTNAMKLRNVRGVKAHSITLLDTITTLDLELVLRKDRAPMAAADAVPMEAEGEDAESSPTVEKLYTLQVTLNNIPLPPYPPPNPPSGTDDSSSFTPHPSLGFRLALPAYSAARKKTAGPGNWNIEVFVKWKEVEKESGVVKGTGKEAYEVFIKRI